MNRKKMLIKEEIKRMKKRIVIDIARTAKLLRTTSTKREKKLLGRMLANLRKELKRLNKMGR